MANVSPNPRDRELDHQIQQLLEARDEDVLLLIEQHYGPLLRRRLERDLSLSSDEVDDAFQRGCAKAWKHHRSYKPDVAPFRAWLYSVVRRCAVDILAERSQAGGIQIEEWDRLEERPQQVASHYAEVLRAVIETLAPLQRAVIEADLGDPSGAAPAELIAKSMGTTRESVYNARIKARRAIEKRLQKRGIDLRVSEGRDPRGEEGEAQA